MRVELSGGTPEVIASAETFTSAIAIDDSYVYFETYDADAKLWFKAGDQGWVC